MGKKIMTYVDESTTITMNEGDAVLIIRANEDVEAFVWEAGDDGMMNGAGTAVGACACICADEDVINAAIDAYMG